MKTFDVNNIQLKIQSPGIKVSNELFEYIISNIEKLGNTFLRIKKCELLLKNEKDSHDNNCMAEAKLFIPQHVLFSKDKSDNFKVAFKNVFDDLHDQLIRIKEKQENVALGKKPKRKDQAEA